MSNNFFSAKLTGLKKISVNIFSEFILPENPRFSCFKGECGQVNVSIVRKVSMNNQYLFELSLEEDYDFKHPYYLTLDHFPVVVIDVTEAAQFSEFDQMFNYDGNDLGAIYSKKQTSFALWAPLATSCFLLLEIKGKFVLYPMDRGDKGVYRVTVKGDFKNHNYEYLVTNNSIPVETTDPFGIGVSLDSKYSAVIDLDEIKALGKVEPKSPFKKYTESIIYEAHVKDFTADKHTDIENKGTFLGFVEPNRKTLKGNPAGLDYLSSLGITHVQLQPIHDYNGLGDKNDKWYNWGYDPISYFAIEGSLSSQPDIPSARLIELKTMINKLHERDLRVNLDVVFNHIYEYKFTSFEKTVPNYFFRRKKNGELYMSSGCGDDVDSSRYMVRKMIIDSLKYFTEVFDFDGYRFDLMGLLDVTTMNKIEEVLRPLKPNIMLYGEGWHMYSNLPDGERASILNADKIPTYAFFNDLFRDIGKGENFQDRIAKKGFINGDVSYKYGFDYIFFGSVLNHAYNPRFKSASQSINYLECHDNNTLFDKYLCSNKEEDTSTLLKRINLGNACILCSFGIPFFHMGQEIGLSKSGHDNTYNVPKINNMNWKLVDERIDMINYFKGMVELRKRYSFLNETDPSTIESNFKIEFWDNNVVKISCDTDFCKPYKDFTILINVENENKTYTLPDYYSLVMSKDDTWSIKNGIINACTLDILYKI